MSWVGLFSPRILQMIKTQPRLGFLRLRRNGFRKRHINMLLSFYVTTVTYKTLPRSLFSKREPHALKRANRVSVSSF